MKLENRNTVSGISAIALAVAATVSAAPAWAQEKAVAPDDKSPGIADIVVTAQKRSESLQQTPLAISAVKMDTLETRGITDVVGLSAVAPSLTATAGTGRSNLILKIRGIGESDVQLTNDSPIGVYVDGVIVGRAAGGSFELLDLERVEVLRGPQGTLYGRNTTGGAVNLITRKPADDFGAEVMGSFGRWNYLQGRASIDTGRLGETGLAARVSFLHRQREGYFDNRLSAPDRDPGSFNTESVRAALSYDKGGPFRASYAFDYTHMVSTAAQMQLTAATQRVLDYFGASQSLGGAAFLPPQATQRDYSAANANVTTDMSMGHNLTLELDVSDHLTIRSITGLREMESDLVDGDIDGQSGLVGLIIKPGTPSVRPVRLFDGDIYRKQRQFSQEINLIGSIGDRVNYVLGAYAFDESGNENNPQKLTMVIPFGDNQLGGVNVQSNLVYRAESKSKALFGQATYKLTPDLSVTGGMRYTWDEKRMIQSSPDVRDLTGKWSNFNWALTLQYQATPDIMTYLRVATGYKAGGFNVRAINNSYNPEFVTSYEAGIKSDLLDRHLRVNATLFYMQLKDKQLNQLQASPTGIKTTTVNAGKAAYQGVELELEALPFDKLRLNAALGYTDPTFKSFLYRVPSTGVTEDIGNGAQFTYSSKLTLNAGGEYTFGEVLGGELSARLDYAYRSAVRYNVVPFETVFDEAIRAKGYGLLDGRIMLSKVPVGPSTATFTLWGRNLTNAKYRTQGIDFGSLGFAVNSYGEPTSYGIDVKFTL